MATKRAVKETAEIIPLFGRDEMNLVEFPFGPVTSAGGKTFEVEHPVFDRALNREVTRKLVITGCDAYGLPRPIDDQVLLGMKALTYEAGFKSPRVEFTRYRLCKTIGWSTDGRSYRRLEEAFDRIAGTTLKFKDSWWDSTNHRPSELIRLLQRSADWLIECGYLRDMRITRDETSGKVQALFVKAGTSALKSDCRKLISNTAQADKLVAWFRNQSAERQASIEEKAVKFCRANHKPIFDGYDRTKAVGGDAFERYREMLVKTFIESRTKSKAA